MYICVNKCISMYIYLCVCVYRDKPEIAWWRSRAASGRGLKARRRSFKSSSGGAMPPLDLVTLTPHLSILNPNSLDTLVRSHIGFKKQI